MTKDGVIEVLRNKLPYLGSNYEVRKVAVSGSLAGGAGRIYCMSKNEEDKQ